MPIIDKDVLNFNKCIIKTDLRGANIKGSKDKNTNETNLVLIRT